MSPFQRVKFDEIGYWSQIKLDIVKEYATAYSRILTAQSKPPFYHVYIDAFAGSGVHISRETGQFVLGSPLNALWIKPPFREYHLIDIDQKKVELLRQLTSWRTNVHIYEGDCNRVLLEKVFPRVRYENYQRGLCLLDPYGLHLNWDVIKTAGESRSIEIFLNFPVADINRNVLWHNPKGVAPEDLVRMKAFWGDDSWREIAYTQQRGLFDNIVEKEPNETVAAGFRERLIKVAGFQYVPEPMPMRNSKGAIVYYLFFASQKPVAQKIVEEIFAKYRH